MQLEVIRRDHGRDLVPLHLVLGESLLHALADEVLTVLRQPVEDLDESQRLHVGLLRLGRIVLHGVNGAAAELDLSDSGKEVLVHYLETTGGGEQEQHAQVKQVLLFELLNGHLLREVVGVTLLHETRRRPTVNSIRSQLTKFLLDQALTILKVFK